MTLGVMFHHFHNKLHKKSQGSISSTQLIKIINYLRKKYKILSAQDYLYKTKNNQLKKNEICLTFDDNLKSQIKIAYPVLKREKITAFFFIYTGIYKKKSKDYLEVFRDFRCTQYKNINKFYLDFFRVFNKMYNIDYKKFISKFKSNYLKNYKFYNLDDRKYRFCRDKILEKKKFEKIMFKLMVKKKYNHYKVQKKLFMSKTDIKKLIRDKNIIGLHSETHPANIYKLTFSQQYRNYKNNLNFFKKNLGYTSKSMSHPFGRYNLTTLKVLKKLKIDLGFLSETKKLRNRSNLEINRLDHIEVLKKI